MLEVDRRGGGWRVPAVGQRWAAGRPGPECGIDVDAEPDQPATPGSPEPDLVPRQSELERLTRRAGRAAPTGRSARLDRQASEARESIVETNELGLLQEGGPLPVRHPNDDVLVPKQRLDGLRAKVKEAISKRTAVRGKSGWTLDGSPKDWAAVVRQFSDLMLRTHNIEADHSVRTVRANTIDSAKRHWSEPVRRSSRTAARWASR